MLCYLSISISTSQVERMETRTLGHVGMAREAPRYDHTLSCPILAGWLLAGCPGWLKLVV